MKRKIEMVDLTHVDEEIKRRKIERKSPKNFEIFDKTTTFNMGKHLSHVKLRNTVDGPGWVMEIMFPIFKDVTYCFYHDGRNYDNPDCEFDVDIGDPVKFFTILKELLWTGTHKEVVKMGYFFADVSDDGDMSDMMENPKSRKSYLFMELTFTDGNEVDCEMSIYYKKDIRVMYEKAQKLRRALAEMEGIETL